MSKNKIIDALKRVKDGVINTTSDILSAPSRFSSGIKRAHAESEYKRIKQEQGLRAMDKANVPDKGNESDPLFRYRINEINKAFDQEHERLKAK